MFVPLLVASHKAVAKNINKVKKLKIFVNFAVVFKKKFIIRLFDSIKLHLCGDQIEHKQNNCLKIGKTWRIAPMLVAFKKDDL